MAENCPSRARKRIEFRLSSKIGRQDKKVAKFVMQKAKKYQEIKACGEYSQKQIREAYSRTDVLVCPSRSDTMPIVVTEAMMCHIPV